MQKLTERQQQLREWLGDQSHLSIEEIMARFQISSATAYRDTHALLHAGLAEKTNRGIKQVHPDEPVSHEGRCSFCGGPVHEKVAFMIQMQDGSQYHACCPHCGLMALKREGAIAALANDFIYGRMINARRATFLVNSMVQICCDPSVLCFASEDDAQRFQLGFGGEICSLDEASSRICDLMALGSRS
jgi:DeoR family transcriptional regulator, copper-sensing transcriptional repressor